jgi:hypothetical protein
MKHPKEKEIMNNRSNAVVVVGSQVALQSVVISEPTIVAAFKAAEADSRDLVEYAKGALEIGVKALQVTGVSLGIEQLSDGITGAQLAMSSAAKKLSEDLTARMEAVAGEDGALSKSLSLSIAQFAKQLEELTGGEKSPIREGIKAQLETLSKGLLEGFSRVALTQREETARLLDIESPQSPLRLLASNLKGLSDSVTDLHTKLDQSKGAELESKVGTRKGGTYEKDAIDSVAQIARMSQDEPLATGGSTERGTSKKGDGVVRLREGLVVKANLVVEAKNMSSKKTDVAKLRYWNEQAEAARKNRGAIGFLGLCKNLEDMPGGQRLIALDKMGQNLVVAYDPDKGEEEFLALVYQVVKMHCLSTVSTGIEINPVALQSYVQSGLEKLKKFAKITDHVKSIKDDSQKILDVAEDIKDDLTEYLRAINREISGGVRQISLEPIVPLELTDVEGWTETEESDDDGEER